MGDIARFGRALREGKLIGAGSGMDNGFKQFTDGSYQVVVLANWDPPAGGRLADAIIRYLGAEIDRGRR